MRSKRILILAVGMIALLATAPVAEALPSGPQSARGDGWLPWLGCWELLNDRVGDVEEPIEGDRMVCLQRTEVGAGAKLTSFVDGEAVLEQTIITDGREHPVSDSDCEGTTAATWSGDGQRLFTRSDLVCEGGLRRTQTSIGLIANRSTWIDIQVVSVAGQRELLARKFRLAGADMAAAAGAPALELEESLSVSTARMAAASPLDASDVIEALARVDPAVVEAAILETDSSFNMNADLLLRLADAEVPAEIIDLMVALSYPDYFVVDDGRDYYGGGGGGGGGVVGGYGGYGRYGWWGYQPYAYGYYSPAFTPFGYGGRFNPIGPFFGRPDSQLGGRVVKGKGYTRVGVRDDAPSGFSRLLSGGGQRGGGVTNGGSVGRGSYTGGGSSSTGGGKTRKVKPRGQ